MKQELTALNGKTLNDILESQSIKTEQIQIRVDPSRKAHYQSVANRLNRKLSTMILSVMDEVTEYNKK